MRSVGICLGEEPHPFMYKHAKEIVPLTGFTVALFVAREARE